MSCAWPECATRAAAWCGPHWDLLPSYLRDGLTRAYNRNRSSDEQSYGYWRVVSDALRWIRTTFDGGAIRERYEPAKWERLVRFVRERDDARTRRRCTP